MTAEEVESAIKDHVEYYLASSTEADFVEVPITVMLKMRSVLLLTLLSQAAMPLCC